MIIIDRQASSKLIQHLKALPETDRAYCIHYKQTGPGACSLREKIMETLSHLPDAQLYCFEDGELCLFDGRASLKDCKQRMLDVASAMKQPVENVCDLYDLTLQTGTLILILEKKIELRRTMQEMLHRQQQEELANRKRQKILEQCAVQSAEEIATKRIARGEPLLMIVEDDPFSRRLVENVLQKQYALTALESADKALSTYAALAPDLVFLDIDLPDVTGHELLEKIIALDPNAYVVMLSGNADKDNIMQAMSHGAKGFVAKPFSRDKLFQYIERCPTIISKEIVQ